VPSGVSKSLPFRGHRTRQLLQITDAAATSLRPDGLRVQLRPTAGEAGCSLSGALATPRRGNHPDL
jgi:hypothetical protein